MLMLSFRGLELCVRRYKLHVPEFYGFHAHALADAGSYKLQRIN